MKLEDQTEKKKIIEEKIKLQKKQQKKAEEKIKVEEEKKQKFDLIVAQNLINDIEEFIKKNPDEFDVIEIFQLLIANKKIKDGFWGENSRENYQKLSDFVNSSVAFKSYHLAKEKERFENAM